MPAFRLRSRMALAWALAIVAGLLAGVAEPGAAPLQLAQNTGAPLQLAPNPAPRSEQRESPRVQDRPSASRIAISNPPLPRLRPPSETAPAPTGPTPAQAPGEAAPASPELAQPGEMTGPNPLEGLDLSPGVVGPPLDLGEEEIEIGPQQDYALALSAKLTDDGVVLPSGLVWRVFRAQPSSDGSFELVVKSEEPRPSFVLPADDYIVHVAYGRANVAKRVSLREGPASEQIALNAGGLRLTCVDVKENDLEERQVTIAVYSSEEDEYGQRRLIVDNAVPEQIIRLNPGTYHIVSRYGDANALVRADIKIEPGQLTDATIEHRAAAVTFKLVNEPGGEALANTSWSVLSPGGDVVKETMGAFPTHVLAAGEYSVIARNEGRLYNRDFHVEPGVDTEVELVAQ